MSLPDAIEVALDEIKKTFERKSSDYAEDDDWASNFKLAASTTGGTPVEVVDTLIAVKNARLVALRANGRAPTNETVRDTYLDRAVYAIIALALV